MKKLLYISTIALLGGLLAQPLTTQAQVSLKSISVGASYWKPSLDYWNNTYSGTTTNNKFSGGVMPTAGIEVGLVKGLSVGGRIGYWKQSISNDLGTGQTSRTEKLSLSVIPLSLDLKYSLINKDSASFIPYIGAGLTRYLINSDFTRTVSSGTGSLSQSLAGNNYGVQIFVGVEKRLVKGLYLALDVRYHLGSYNQVVKGETTTTTQKVSLNGLEAGLSARYKFK